MKIAIILARFYPNVGGGETYVFNIANYLSSLNHDVTVITGRNNSRNSSRFGFQILEIDGLDDSNPEIITAFPQLHAHFSINTYDVVHVNNYMSYFLLLNAVEISKRSVYLLSIHNTPDLPRRVFSTFNNYESELLFAKRLLDDGPHKAIIVGSPIFSEGIEQISSRSQNIEEVNFGVSIQPKLNQRKRKRIRNALGVKDEEILLISSGRFVRRKNLVMLIKTLSMLPCHYKLLMTGSANPEGPETYQEVIKAIRQYELEDRVILLDSPLKFTDLYAYYATADTYVLSSIKEGFGISVIEAMSCGIPVVCTDVPGPKEIISNGVNGFLVPLDDANRMAKVILKVNEDIHLKNYVIEAAYRLLGEKYNADIAMKAHVELYKKYLTN